MRTEAASRSILKMAAYFSTIRRRKVTMEALIIKFQLGEEACTVMISMEQKKQRDDRLTYLLENLRKQFQSVKVNGKDLLQTDNGTVFTLTAFPGDNALVIEYAENIFEAELNRFEDGERFYLEDYKDAERMLDDMLKEVQND